MKFIICKWIVLTQFLLTFFTIFPVLSIAQNKFTISGFVKDKLSGETLPGVYVSLKESNAGTSTNIYGFYSITLQTGKYSLNYEFLGYKKQTVLVDLTRAVMLSIDLTPDVYQQEEVVITSNKKEDNVRGIDIGKVEIDVEQTKRLPVLFGETDLLKTLQLLPGVQAGGEGSTGLYVRGGGPDQNLVLLDEGVVYNTGHLFGFFSVFNTDAIKSLTLYKGNMPAKFGGRISSVLEFTMKEGNNKEFHIQGGIGLIASRITLEGPIKKEKSSFTLSLRRTYIDQITKPLIEREGIRGVPYYFYDINAKTNYLFSDKNKLFLSLYSGRDNVHISFLNGRLDSRTIWGNNTMTLRWNHVINSKIFANSTLIYNNYIFSSNAKFDNFDTQVNSKIQDFTAKVDLDYYLSLKHKLKTGAAIIYHNFIPRRTYGNASGIEFNATINTEKYATESALYISDDFTLTDKIEFNVGFRLHLFQQKGPYTYINNLSGTYDTIFFKKLETVKSYLNPEPRLGFRFLMTNSSSIKSAFNYNNQYIHLVSVSGNALPFDLWVPSSNKIKPQQGWQYSIGYFKNLKNNVYEFSTELYYKRMRNLVEYRQDYVPKVSEEPEAEYVFGNGLAFGAEFLFRKNSGRLKGWIGYTLSKATRKFPDINQGLTFPARYDRRNDASIVATFALTTSWTLGTTFVYATGQAITLPSRRYFIEGVIYNQYGSRNSFRMQAYHRLDLSATFERKKKNSKFHSSWTFAIYNLYNRKNPYIYFINAQGDPTNDNLAINAKKLYLFPILPSVTWNFKF